MDGVINLKSKMNKLTIYIMALGIFGVMNTEMGITGILPQLTTYYGVTIDKASLLVSLFALVIAISGPIMPFLLSKFNKKHLMLLSLGIFFIGNIVSATTDNFTLTLVARLIPAVMHPVYVSITLTLAASTGNLKENKQNISIIMLAVSAGMVLGVPLSNFIAYQYSIPLTMVFHGLINFIAFSATLLFIPSLEAPLEKVSYGNQLGELKSPLPWITILMVISIGAILASLNSFLSEFLQTVSKFDASVISALLLVFGLASIGGNLIASKLLYRFNSKTIRYFPAFAFIFFLVLFLFGQNQILMIGLLAVFGIVFAVGNQVNQDITTSSIKNAPELANGLYVSASNWGTSLGTIIGGIVVTNYSGRYLAVVGILFISTLLISSVVKAIVAKKMGINRLETLDYE